MNQSTKKVGLFEKLVYGSGQVGMNVMYTLFSSYVLLFYTDVIGINPAMIGGVILASKIFDGVSDLIAGQLIDTHKNDKGHCIPVLARWSIPMVFSVVLVFMVPDTSKALQLAFVFITYNLFNTVLYTYTAMAYGTLPTYVTNDPIDRSQMMIYAMLFAGATQTIMASTITPMIEFFGGMGMQSAWVKSCLVFGVKQISDVTGAYSYLVEGNEKAVLIDTGTGVGNLKSYVDTLTDKPITVLLTHGHCDHAGGAALFEDVYLSEADWNLVEQHASMDMKVDYVHFCCPDIFEKLLCCKTFSGRRAGFS